jgi:hypothetical protein
MDNPLLLKGDKTTVLKEVEAFLQSRGYSVVAKDFARPWGGFFVLDETQAAKFGDEFSRELKSIPSRSKVESTVRKF